jgi:hypothetical protein
VAVFFSLAKRSPYDFYNNTPSILKEVALVKVVHLPHHHLSFININISINMVVVVVVVKLMILSIQCKMDIAVTSVSCVF